MYREAAEMPSDTCTAGEFQLELQGRYGFGGFSGSGWSGFPGSECDDQPRPQPARAMMVSGGAGTLFASGKVEPRVPHVSFVRAAAPMIHLPLTDVAVKLVSSFSPGARCVIDLPP